MRIFGTNDSDSVLQRPRLFEEWSGPREGDSRCAQWIATVCLSTGPLAKGLPALCPCEEPSLDDSSSVVAGSSVDRETLLPEKVTKNLRLRASVMLQRKPYGAHRDLQYSPTTHRSLHTYSKRKVSVSGLSWNFHGGHRDKDPPSQLHTVAYTSPHRTSLCVGVHKPSSLGSPCQYSTGDRIGTPTHSHSLTTFLVSDKTRNSVRNAHPTELSRAKTQQQPQPTHHRTAAQPRTPTQTEPEPTHTHTPTLPGSVGWAYLCASQ